jgi:uncharacterized membrane protein YcaP (DUF421 family)
MTGNPTYDALIRAALFSLAALFWVIVLVRMAGVRSLSKMTAFDFVVTLATGSLLATAGSASGWTAFVQTVAAMTVLLVAQEGLTVVRRSPRLRRLIENEPLLLMRDGDYIEGAMRRGRVTHDDLRAKIRAVDLSGPREVSLMILETTGDISILTTPPSGEKMTSGVRGIDR